MENTLLKMSSSNYSRGGYCTPAALKLFEAKPITQLLYGAPEPLPNSASIELVQSKFLRSAVQVPKCVMPS